MGLPTVALAKVGLKSLVSPAKDVSVGVMEKVLFSFHLDLCVFPVAEGILVFNFYI